ncbi:hypothetical protein ALC57_17601, partial [Trachymyrmex cornetzi]
RNLETNGRLEAYIIRKITIYKRIKFKYTQNYIMNNNEQCNRRIMYDNITTKRS